MAVSPETPRADPDPDPDVARERDLYRALLELGGRDEIEPFLDEALALMVALTGARRGYIELTGEGDEPQFWMEHGCYDADVEAIRALFSRGIIADAVASGQTVAVDSALHDPRFHANESVLRNQTGPVLCAPLGKPPLGVVYLQDRDADGPFTERDRRVLETVARYLAVFADRLLVRKARLDEADHTRALRAKVGADGIIGRSKALAETLQQAVRAAPVEAGVLITGPSGTGKTQIARFIHDHSGRAGKPFVAQNCAAMQDTLLERELFGAVRGSHSAATQDSQGRVGAAEGGTLFLDEIGDLSPAAQAKLLQVVQDKEYFQIGGTKATKANVRVLAATNADLKAMVAKGTFRAELFYRLDVLRVRVPKLAERTEDVPLLADFFCARFCEANGYARLRFTPSAQRALAAAEWPGNVRELDACVQRAAILSHAEGAAEIEARHVFPDDPEPVTGFSFKTETRRFQRQLVARALAETGWNRSEAARLLEVSRAHVYNLIDDLGLESPSK